jgi:hypothetical protein
MTGALKVRRIASAPARRQAFARYARRPAAGLDCHRRSGSGVNYAVAHATASLINYWLQKHEIPDNPHGARSLLYSYRRIAHPRAAWAARICAARGPNVAAVALANHNARVLWALLSRGENYRAELKQRSFPPRPSAGAAVKRARAGKLLVVKPA